MSAPAEHLGIPRLMWESDHEWESRKWFIETHDSKFADDRDRLGALSMTWANWKFMGCTYPPAVQELLNDLHGELPDHIDMELKAMKEAARPKQKFVKSTENLGGRVGYAENNNDCQSPVARSLSGPSIDPWSSDKDHEDITETKLLDELIPGMIIYLPADRPAEGLELSILNESVQKLRNCLIEFAESADSTLFKCSVRINGRFIAAGSAATIKDAKRDSARNALAVLSRRQVTRRKLPISHDGVREVAKEALVKASYEAAPPIAADTVGSRLLSKMGWSGVGGVGRDEQGRAEPVFVSPADGRRGVGHLDANQSVRKASVEETLEAFARDAGQESMKFEVSLSKEDRALVHRLCRKYQLNSKSYGKDDARYLVISRR